MLVAFALFFSLILFLCISFFSSKGDYATVKVNDFTVAELPLSVDKVYEIETENGITNIIEISGGEVKMISAECPDKICVHHRSISKNGESIICLPNKVVVTVVSQTENEVDGVVK